MRPPPLTAIAALLSLSACSPWDKLGGVKLGEPASSVFHVSPEGHTLFVFSSVFDLCELASDPAGPSGDDWWVVSALVEADLSTGELPAEPYARVSSEGKITEHRGQAGTVEVEELTETDGLLEANAPDAWIEGKVDLDFGEAGRVKAPFEADWCDFNLFQGM
jgi:hypothetical protein